MAEATIIAFACTGDSSAFGELVRRRQSRVPGFMYYLCRNTVEGDFWLVTAANALGERAMMGALLRTIENCGGPYLLMEPRLDRLEAEGFLESDKANDPWRRRYRVTEYGSRALARASAEKRTLAIVAEDLAEEENGSGARENWLGGRCPEESR